MAIPAHLRVQMQRLIFPDTRFPLNGAFCVSIDCLALDLERSSTAANSALSPDVC
jgi:hypothetical protein